MLGARYAAHRDEYVAAGYSCADAYRRAMVAQAWPSVSALVRRYIREGFREGLAREAAQG